MTSHHPRPARVSQVSKQQRENSKKAIKSRKPGTNEPISPIWIFERGVYTRGNSGELERVWETSENGRPQREWRRCSAPWSTSLKGPIRNLWWLTTRRRSSTQRLSKNKINQEIWKSTAINKEYRAKHQKLTSVKPAASQISPFWRQQSAPRTRHTFISNLEREKKEIIANPSRLCVPKIRPLREKKIRLELFRKKLAVNKGRSPE